MHDLGPWLAPLFAPVEIGSWRFAPARLIVAILLLLALLAAVRMTRRALAATVLGPGRIEASVAHSIDKAVGYAGVTLAALTALSVAGLDITNIAIVAGALSVGIGFGLQSVVNNFVSGLILLAERPVKVGDWIEIKGQRGRIARISVRATVIETADGGAIFVPNADLIANPLTNLTPNVPLGVAIVRIGLPHTAEPAAVRAALAEAVASSPLITASPQPSIAFDDIAANALMFSVRAHVADIGRVGAAENQLREAIVAALRRHDIALARPQTDVHLRDLDGVRSLVVRVLEERERRARMQGTGDGGVATS
jgi:small-conductance mechanosensitive channel